VLSEEVLIDRFFAALGAARRDVVLGVGDDGAVLEPPPGRQLVCVVDTLNEGVHFPLGTPPAALGHRLLAVNLSDLAAMGARPAWASLSLSLPTAEAAWLGEFARGLGALAEQHGVSLVGGDTVRGPLSLSLQALGFVPPGEALVRRGARPGDAVFVSGRLGAAAAGLRAFGAGERRGALVDAFLWPRPRVTLGRALRGLATAAIDVSDGLLTDLGRVLAASGAGASVAAGRLPLAAEAVAACGEAEARRLALTGGDDYELCFTVPAAAQAELQRRLADIPVPVTRIGRVEPEPGLRVLDAPPDLPDGWAHFGGTTQ
jgi:thiamine-monophosphate kinase